MRRQLADWLKQQLPCPTVGVVRQDQPYVTTMGIGTRRVTVVVLNFVVHNWLDIFFSGDV